MHICIFPPPRLHSRESRMLSDLLAYFSAQRHNCTIIAPPELKWLLPESLWSNWVNYPAPSSASQALPDLAASYRQARDLSSALEKHLVDVVYTLGSDTLFGPLVAARLDLPHVWHQAGVAPRIGGFCRSSPRHISHFANVIINEPTDLFRGDAGTTLPSVTVPDWVCARSHTLSVSAPADSPGVVDVIVPFYDDPTTVDCLQSLARHASPALGRIIVISDAGPDLETTRRVRDYVQSHERGFEWLENDTNVGFVLTCNRGMRASSRDVILLNTDTLVSPGWLDKLRDAAYSAPDIATVTPLSNYASIFSLDPERTFCNPANVDTVARILERISSPAPLDAPTAHGFCMYIKRAALDHVGFFDETAFGRGNGEENDFSMRARHAGWRNVAALTAYVFHRGGLSFKSDKKVLLARNLPIITSRYPDYRYLTEQFRREDPLRSTRDVLQLLLGENAPPLHCRFVVFVTDAPNETAKRPWGENLKCAMEQMNVALLVVSAGSKENAHLRAHRRDPAYEIHVAGSMMPFLSISALLVFSSRATEHVGETLAAMRLGRPVLVTAQSALADLLPPQNSITLGCSEPIEVAEQVLQILRDERRLASIGTEGAAIAASLTSVEACEAPIEHAAKELIGQRNPAFITTFCIDRICGASLPRARLAQLIAPLGSVGRFAHKVFNRLSRR